MRNLMSARPNVVAFVLTTVVFAVAISWLNVGLGLTTLSLNVVLSALALGGMTSLGGLFLTRLAGRQAIHVGTFAFTAGLACAVIYYGMSLAVFSGGDPLGAFASFLVGFVSGLVGAIGTRVLTNRP